MIETGPPSRWARPRLPLRRVEDIPEPPRARWYAVHTRARAERGVNLRLREARYWTFYPQILVVTNHARSSDEIAQPFLPRYVFAQVLPDQDFFTIAETAGVSCIIHGADGAPMPIDDRQMARLIAMAAPDGIVTLDRPSEPAISFAENEPVIAAEGPFEGHHGLVVAMDGKHRATVEFGNFEVSLPVEWLRRT